MQSSLPSVALAYQQIVIPGILKPILTTQCFITTITKPAVFMYCVKVVDFAYSFYVL
jgi:hypothetical protein